MKIKYLFIIAEEANAKKIEPAEVEEKGPGKVEFETRDRLDNIGSFLKDHPLAVISFAVVGLLGFLITIVGYGIDRDESEASSVQVNRNLEGIEEVGKDVSAVKQIVSSDCTGPPCWSLREAARARTIGIPKDLVDRKLPAPLRLDNGQYQYELDGCRMNIEYTDDAVSYFSVSLRKYIQHDSEGYDYSIEPCDFDLDEFLSIDDKKWPIYTKITVASILDVLGHTNGQNEPRPLDLQISSACIDCGNYREPYLEFMQFGPHANGFVNLHVITSFNAVDDESGDKSYELLASFKESMRQKVGDPNYSLDTPPLCNKNIAREISQKLRSAQVDEIGFGKGARSWSNVLFCKWWE